MLVRFIAACLMGMSVVELALYWVEYKFRNAPVNIFFSALWIVLFLLGMVVLIKAKAIAEWISDRLE